MNASYQNLTALERERCIYNARMFVEMPHFRTSIRNDSISDYDIKVITGENYLQSRILFDLLFKICFYPNGDKPENEGYISTFITFSQDFSDWKVTFFSFTAVIAVIDTNGDLRFLQSFAEEHNTEVEWKIYQEARYRFGLEKYLKRTVILNSSDLLHGGTLKLSCDVVFSIKPSPTEVHWHQCLFDQQELLEGWFLHETKQLPPFSNSYRHSLKLDNESPLCISLQQRSVYFQQLFNTSLEEKTSKLLPISDEEYPAFFNMLCYIRFDTLEHIYKINDYFDLYVVSDKYQVLDLKKLCSTHMRRHITIRTAVKMLVLFDMCNDLDFKQFVIHYILANKCFITQTSEWELLMRERRSLAGEIVRVNGDCEEFLPLEKNQIDWFSSKNYFRINRLHLASADTHVLEGPVAPKISKFRDLLLRNSAPVKHRICVPSPPNIITENREQTNTNAMQSAENSKEFLAMKQTTASELDDYFKPADKNRISNFDFYK